MLLLDVKAVEDVWADEAFWQGVQIEMASRLGAITRRLVVEGAVAAQSVGVIVDFDAIHQEALHITRTTESLYWGKMTQTTREGLRQALLSWQEQGLGKRGLPDLIDSIEPLFDRNRAKRIAITEATRLFAEGNMLAARLDENVGGLEWQTAQDDKVCEAICLPLHKNIYAKGSEHPCPAHTNCRCALIPVSWRYIRAHVNKWQGGALPLAEVA